MHSSFRLYHQQGLIGKEIGCPVCGNTETRLYKKHVGARMALECQGDMGCHCTSIMILTAEPNSQRG